jgi:hypothetical protein
LNGILEKKSQLRWEVAGILTIGEKKERLSIFRDRNSEFERTAVFWVSGLCLSKMERIPLVDEIDRRDFVKPSRPERDRQ